MIGPPGGEVTDATVAEPAGAGTNILVARYGELTPAAMDGPVAVDVRYIRVPGATRVRKAGAARPRSPCR